MGLLEGVVDVGGYGFDVGADGVADVGGLEVHADEAGALDKKGIELSGVADEQAWGVSRCIPKESMGYNRPT